MTIDQPQQQRRTLRFHHLHGRGPGWRRATLPLRLQSPQSDKPTVQEQLAAFVTSQQT